MKHAVYIASSEPKDTAGARKGPLIVRLFQGDYLLVEGALMRFTRRVDFELWTQCRFVFGRHYLSEDLANTPMKAIYFHLQQGYAGPAADRGSHLRQVVGTLSDAATPLSRELLELIEKDLLYPALVKMRAAISAETASGTSGQ